MNDSRPAGLVAQAVVEALARRAAAQQGEAQRLLWLRVAELRAQAMAAPLPAPAAAVHNPLAALTALVDRLGRTAPARPGTAAPAPLKAVAAFKGTWSRLRAEQRLRQALAQVPAQAGPLNSSHLVHGALQAMHGLSPAYLDAFMAHVDTLLWLEQASAGSSRPAPVRPNRKT